jgi:hypothetical protein
LGVAAIEIEDEQRNRFRSVPGSFQGLQPHAAEFNRGAIGERREPIFSCGLGAEIDGGATIPKFEMTGDEISMEVGKKHMFDLEPVFVGEGQIAVNIALRIDNGGDARGFVAHKVGGVREAVEVKLLKQQERLLSAAIAREYREEPRVATEGSGQWREQRNS